MSRGTGSAAMPIAAANADLGAHAGRSPLVERVSEAVLPLRDATFTVVGYRDLVDGREHLAAVLGDVASRRDVLTHLHSECLTGDVLRSRRCECGEQLDRALRMIAEEGSGVVVYLRGHEGRGIGRLAKLVEYELQDRGLDTVDANLALGRPADARDDGVGGRILADLGVGPIRLLTSNPAKRAALERHGVAVAATVGLELAPATDNARHLATQHGTHAPGNRAEPRMIVVDDPSHERCTGGTSHRSGDVSPHR